MTCITKILIVVNFSSSRGAIIRRNITKANILHANCAHEYCEADLKTPITYNPIQKFKRADERQQLLLNNMTHIALRVWVIQTIQLPDNFQKPTKIFITSKKYVR